MTWKDMNIKYPEDRHEMTKEREREFGRSFEVIGRTTEKDADLECLPMWKIRFDDGFEMDAYPDEIIPSEMANYGCPKEYLIAE